MLDRGGGLSTETRLQADYPPAKHVSLQPIRRPDYRNPCLSGKCRIGLRASGGPFKDLMPSFHFSRVWRLYYLGPALPVLCFPLTIIKSSAFWGPFLNVRNLPFAFCLFVYLFNSLPLCLFTSLPLSLYLYLYTYTALPCNFPYYSWHRDT